MNWIDLWAMAALALGGASLALRGYMLKPEFLTWVDAPRAISFALVVLALVMGGRFMAIRTGAHANAGEALVYSALAYTATVMLANLVRQKRPSSVLAQLMDRLDDGGRAALDAALNIFRNDHPKGKS